MNHTAFYKTRQKEIILSYLKSSAGTLVTANDIHDYFAKKNISIGLATIYRHLEKLLADGMVKKCFVDGSLSAHFEYTDNDENYFHLKCAKCKKIINFQCKELMDAQRHLSDEHGFCIDSPKTILYGTCGTCSETKKT